MATNEELLERFARRLGQESYQQYHSCYSKVMGILQEELNIAEGIEAGSLAMGFKIKDSGDLDVIFTYINIEKDAPTIRQELCDALTNGLGNKATVRLDNPQTSRSVKVDFENEIKMDVVYKDYRSYEREKNMINHFNNLPEIILNTIRLVKYVQINFSNNKIDKSKIHKFASTSTGNSLSAKVNHTINQCGGGGDKTPEMFSFLIQEASRG